MPNEGSKPAHLTRDSSQKYLQDLFNSSRVRLVGLAPLSDTTQADSLKGYGYGKPVALTYELDGKRRRAVLHTVKPGPFGHEHLSDRAAELLWSHRAFNQLPLHVRSLDIGTFDSQGHMVSLGETGEFFLLTEFVEGSEYAHDLVRLRQGADATSQDWLRGDALCDYLLEIHRVKGNEPGLYTRRIRELVGHSQCIMGLTDSYPQDHPWITPRLLESIEQRAVTWRWRIKDRTHRLAQVHGDFHPWNILFEEANELHVLDRSRGQWGDPADDVVSLTMNYVFESLQATGRFEGTFAKLFDRFWSRYLDFSGDREMLEVAGPFVAFRGLVMASPVWYPHIHEDARRKMLALVEASLDADMFEPDLVHETLQTTHD